MRYIFYLAMFLLILMPINNGDSQGIPNSAYINQSFNQIIPLKIGWNHISVGLNISNSNISSVLESIQGFYESVWAYDNSTGWKKYIPDAAEDANNLENIEPGEGYEIYMNIPANLWITGEKITQTSIPLFHGWNFVGYNSLTAMSIGNATLSLPADTYIYAYDSEIGGWQKYVVGGYSFFNSLEVFEPGHGYWFHVKQDCIWSINSSQQNDYAVFAWNDLGMHCLNPTYDTAVILPPYNNIWAQVIRRDNRPQIVTEGLTAEYRIINNTYSYGKRSYGQFWDYCKQLFGIELAHNTGLNLVDSDIHNGLSGKMVSKDGYFVADGIPATPVDDSGIWNPYQVVEITIRNISGVVAKTRATVPVSDEIDCARCHGDKPFEDVLEKHDGKHQTNLTADKPVLCASCHGSPALGTGGKGSSGKYMSEAIHGSHASRGAACIDCHPGAITQCSRSIKHTSADGNCITCHGDMDQVANSITSGSRIPWVNEPKCVDCHKNVAQVDTGDVLYRNAKGHGSMYCTSCHGSPHAMVPTNQGSDNYQAIQYQGKAKSIGSCGACHPTSRGIQDLGEFSETHAGTNYEHRNSCHICHTSITTATSQWPHAYQWKSR